MKESTRMSFSLGYATVIYILFHRRNHCFSPLSHLPPISLGGDLHGWWPGCWDLEKFQGLFFFFFLTDSTLHLSANRLFGILWASVKPTVVIHVLSHDADIEKAVSSLMEKNPHFSSTLNVSEQNSFKR